MLTFSEPTWRLFFDLALTNHMPHLGVDHASAFQFHVYMIFVKMWSIVLSQLFDNKFKKISSETYYKYIEELKESCEVHHDMSRDEMAKLIKTLNGLKKK